MTRSPPMLQSNVLTADVARLTQSRFKRTQVGLRFCFRPAAQKTNHGQLLLSERGGWCSQHRPCNHLVSPHEQRCRKLYADLVGCLKVENHLEPLRLIKRNLTGWRAREYLGDGGGCVPE